MMPVISRLKKSRAPQERDQKKHGLVKTGLEAGFPPDRATSK
jgi:hypothetical protein